MNDNSDGDEYLIIRLDHVEPPLNIINIYGQQEGRDGQIGKDRVVESWGKLKKELCLIQMRGEPVIICGDYNRAVGADKMGIRGNKERISDGGHLVGNLVEEGEYFFLNNLEVAEGGPWTRVDPADGSLSCLDLALGSTNLLPFIRKFEVDNSRMWAPRRVVSKNGVLTYTFTDHYSCKIDILMPASGGQAMVEEKRWNTNKPGGLEKYRDVSDDYAVRMKEIILDRGKSYEEVMQEIDKIQDKIKYTSCGKTKIKRKPKASKKISDNDAAADMMEKQVRLEEHITKMTSSKEGQYGKVFKMREVVNGPKKKAQEAKTIKHPESGELIVSSKEIKKTTLEYCLGVLKENKPAEDVEELRKRQEELFKEIVEGADGKFEISRELFEQCVARFEYKKKKLYNFLVKAGDEFKEAIFCLCKRIIKDEEIQ